MSRTARTATALLGLALAAAITPFGGGVAGADDTIAVNTTVDLGPFDHPSCAPGNANTCSLREAVSTGLREGRNVTVPAGTYRLTEGLLRIGTISADGNTIDATRQRSICRPDAIPAPCYVAISGAGTGRTIIDGGNEFRHFDISPDGFLWLTDVSLVNGNATMQPGDVHGRNRGFLNHQHGGSIHNHGSAILNHVAVRNSRSAAGWGGGAVTNASSTGMSVFDSTFVDNVAGNSAGAAIEDRSGTARLDHVTISQHVGAAVLTKSGTTISNSVLASGAGCVGEKPAFAGKNLVTPAGDTSCGAGAAGVTYTNAPKLGAFDPATDSFSPLAGSPLIDGGDNGVVPQFATDQLGHARADGDGDGVVVCDIGAVEAPAAPAKPSRAVTGFVLVDAVTDRDIEALFDGITLDRASLPAALSMRAATDPGTVGSVRFTIDGADVRVENVAPYTLGGDDNGDYFAYPLKPGQRVITATPYEGRDGTGAAGPTAVLHVTVR